MEDTASWMDEFMEMEYTLTTFEFLLLLQVATGSQSLGALEPVWPWLKETIPVPAIPFVIPEISLLEMASQHKLVRLGLVEIPTYQSPISSELTLTEKGHQAVKYWLGALEEMGFSHPSLSS